MVWLLGFSIYGWQIKGKDNMKCLIKVLLPWSSRSASMLLDIDFTSLYIYRRDEHHSFKDIPLMWCFDDGEKLCLTSCKVFNCYRMALTCSTGDQWHHNKWCNLLLILGCKKTEIIWEPNPADLQHWISWWCCALLKCTSALKFNSCAVSHCSIYSYLLYFTIQNNILCTITTCEQLYCVEKGCESRSVCL